MRVNRNKDKNRLLQIYNLLYKVYGPRHWWPAESAFEVAVGAILTQNTNWQNVEKAISNLKRQNLLDPAKLKAVTLKRLAAAIRPSGYFNLKAKRLKSFVNYLLKDYDGNINQMRKKTTLRLRQELLLINGIGPETADSILLYAVGKPIFVIDAYTKRILDCLGLSGPGSCYSDMQLLFMSKLPKSVKLYNEFHALIVAHGKHACRPKPRCASCTLRSLKGDQLGSQCLKGVL